MRLYSQILNFSMYMLVSHRNMISVYDMNAVTQRDSTNISRYQTVRQSP